MSSSLGCLQRQHSSSCPAAAPSCRRSLLHRPHQPRQARVHVSPEWSARDSGEIVPVNRQSGAFGEVESRIATTFQRPPGGRDDWQELEGCWVLRPPNGIPASSVVYFLGGAFVGAAPQITYRLFLELLAAQGCAVVTVPYATGFDHQQIADQVHFNFQRCMQRLEPPLQNLPVLGMGHSLGSLLQLLIGSRYPVQHAGNCFLSFNNRPVTESIPFLTQFISPGAAFLAPVLQQLAVSPLRAQAEGISELLRGLSPSLARQVMPLLDQLLPMYLDVANGRQEFHPTPQEMQRLARSHYGVPRNLAVRFTEDQIDDTALLTRTLGQGAALGASLDLTQLDLPGDHLRPLKQELPPEVAGAASSAAQQGRPFLDQLSAFARSAGVQGLDEARAQFDGFASGILSTVGSSLRQDTVSLVTDIVRWMDTTREPSKALPSGQPAGQLKP